MLTFCIRVLKPFLILGILGVFAGCALQKHEAEPGSPPPKIENWYIEGKIGLRQQDRSQSAFIKWQQNFDNFRIELYGPFGKGRTWIEKQNNTVTLRDADKELSAASPEELLFKASGVNMPVSWLQSWLLGEPAPGISVELAEIDQYQRLTSFKQDNWKVTYPRFTVVNGFNLPDKLRVSNTDYQLNLVIKSWRIEEPH